MIMLVVTFRVEEQNRAAFEAGLGDFARWSLTNEPGTLLYQLGQDETDPSTYRLIELYADQAALDQHSTSDAYRQVGKTVGPLLAAPPTIVRHAPINNSLTEKA